MIIHSMPEGTTAPQVFELAAIDHEGNPVDLTLDDFTVTIEVHDKNKTLVTGVGAVEVLSPTTVSLTPVPTKWKAMLSPYSVRWVVSSDDGGLFKIPNSIQPDVWQVPKP